MLHLIWITTESFPESQKWLKEPRQDLVAIPPACPAQPAWLEGGFPAGKTAGLIIMFSILLSFQVGQTKHFNWFAVPKYFTNTRRWKHFSASERSQIRLPRGRLGGWCHLGARSPRSAAGRTACLLPRRHWHKPSLAGSRAAAPLPSPGLA